MEICLGGIWGSLGGEGTVESPEVGEGLGMVGMRGSSEAGGGLEGGYLFGGGDAGVTEGDREGLGRVGGWKSVWGGFGGHRVGGGDSGVT